MSTVCLMLLSLLTGKTVSDPNAVWAAYYAAQAQPYTYPAAVQPTLQSVTGQQQAAPYAALSRATVTPQPSMLRLSCRPMIVEGIMLCHCAFMLLPMKQRSVYNSLSRVCLSVCIYVCQMITCESLDVGSSYL